jgi:hypothetical protein
MSGYSHLPEDMRKAITQFDQDVKSGRIRPWNPDTRDEYTDMRATQDLWLTCHLASKLPPTHLGYMLITTKDDTSVTTHDGMYLTAPQM